MTDKSGNSGDDGQWAQGLISAAALVASATQALCEAANTMIQVGMETQCGKHVTSLMQMLRFYVGPNIRTHSCAPLYLALMSV